MPCKCSANGGKGAGGINNISRAEAPQQLCPSTTKCFGFVHPALPQRCPVTFPKEFCTKAREESRVGTVTGEFPPCRETPPEQSKMETKGDGGDSESRVTMLCPGQRLHLAMTSAANRTKNVLESSYLPQWHLLRQLLKYNECIV